MQMQMQTQMVSVRPPPPPPPGGRGGGGGAPVMSRQRGEGALALGLWADCAGQSRRAWPSVDRERQRRAERSGEVRRTAVNCGELPSHGRGI